MFYAFAIIDNAPWNDIACEKEVGIRESGNVNADDDSVSFRKRADGRRHRRGRGRRLRGSRGGDASDQQRGEYREADRVAGSPASYRLRSGQRVGEPAVYDPAFYAQLFASFSVTVPAREPEPVHDPTVWAVVLFIVPAAKPVPVAVQVRLAMPIVSEPLVRSWLETTVSVTLEPAEVRPLTSTVMTGAEIDAVVSGSASVKVTELVP